MTFEDMTDYDDLDGETPRFRELHDVVYDENGNVLKPVSILDDPGQSSDVPA